MIYNTLDNKFYLQLTDKIANESDFYHCGIKIPLKTVQKFLSDRKNDQNQITIIAQPIKPKQPPNNNDHQTIIKKQLPPQDYQLYTNKKSILFEEWQKFRFLRMHDIDAQFEEEQQIEMMEYFSQQKNHEAVIKMQTQPLQFYIKKWREVFRYIVERYSDNN